MYQKKIEDATKDQIKDDILCGFKDDSEKNNFHTLKECTFKMVIRWY